MDHCAFSKERSFITGHLAGLPQVRRRGRTEHNLRWALAVEGKTLKDRTEMNIREANKWEEEKKEGDGQNGRKRHRRTEA